MLPTFAGKNVCVRVCARASVFVRTRPVLDRLEFSTKAAGRIECMGEKRASVLLAFIGRAMS